MIAVLRRSALAALAAIALLHLAWHAAWAPPQRLPLALVLALAWLPLVPALLAARDPRRALLIGAIACLGYFCHGVMEAYGNAAARAPALVEVALATYVIVALGAAVLREKADRRRDAAARARDALRAADDAP